MYLIFRPWIVFLFYALSALAFASAVFAHAWSHLVSAAICFAIAWPMTKWKTRDADEDAEEDKPPPATLTGRLDDLDAALRVRDPDDTETILRLEMALAGKPHDKEARARIRAACGWRERPADPAADADPEAVKAEFRTYHRVMRDYCQKLDAAILELTRARLVADHKKEGGTLEAPDGWDLLRAWRGESVFGARPLLKTLEEAGFVDDLDPKVEIDPEELARSREMTAEMDALVSGHLQAKIAEGKARMAAEVVDQDAETDGEGEGAPVADADDQGEEEDDADDEAPPPPRRTGGPSWNKPIDG